MLASPLIDNLNLRGIDMSRNPQTEAAKAASQKLDSTHSSAAQASAARLIRELRKHYSQVINTEVEATAEIKKAQQYLCDYLTHLTQNKSFTEDVRLKRHPAVVETIRTIDHIVYFALVHFSPKDVADLKALVPTDEKNINPMLKELFEKIQLINLNKKDYNRIKFSLEAQQLLKAFLDEKKREDLSAKLIPLQDKINALSQMLSIVKTHPGFEKWSNSDIQWSQNNIYNAELKTPEVVNASPAETLNLVCAALFDPSHLVAGASVDEDSSARIHSLFNYLKNLFEEEKKGNYTICAAGRQHGILFLLNHVFCENPHQPAMMLIEDQNTFALNELSQFIKTQLEASPDKSSEVVSDWILYQNGMIEREVDPVIAFLRQRFPSDQKDNLDANWKSALDKYLKNQFAAFGLNPATCQSSALADNIAYIQPPTVNPLLAELLKSQPLSANGSLESLTEQRNRALEKLKTQLRSNAQLSSDEIASLYVAEMLFQKLYKHRYHALLIGADDPAYQAALQNAEAELKHIFETHSRSQQFEIVHAEYQKQLDKLDKRSYYDFIENFFVRETGFWAKESKLEEIRDQSPLEEGVHPFLVTDHAINEWFLENTASEYPGVIDVTPYEINRILLHVLILKDRPNQQRESIIFSRAVELIVTWIIEPDQDSDSESKKSLKKTYLTQLSNYWIYFTPYLSPEALKIFCTHSAMVRSVISLFQNGSRRTPTPADFINRIDPQRIRSFLEGISTNEALNEAFERIYRYKDNFILLLSQISADKVELVFQLLNHLPCAKNKSFNEFLGITNLHIEALDELQNNGLTLYHFLKWAPTKPFQEAHKKALVFLVKTKQLAPDKAISELNKLTDYQALRILAGFSSDDVYDLSEYKLQALEELHQYGLTGDFLRSCIEDYPWRFEEIHKNALIYLIREKNIAPADAIATIKALSADQLKAVLAGLSREEVRGLKSVQLETLIELRNNGLTGDHLRTWSGISSFLEHHKKALIFLIRTDNIKPLDAVRLISDVNQETLLKTLASPIDVEIKKIFIQNKNWFNYSASHLVYESAKLALFEVDKLKLIFSDSSSIYLIEKWVEAKTFTLDILCEIPTKTLSLFIAYGDKVSSLFYLFGSDLTQFLRLDHADLELILKHLDKVTGILSSLPDKGKNAQVSEIIPLLTNKIHDDILEIASIEFFSHKRNPETNFPYALSRTDSKLGNYDAQLKALTAAFISTWEIKGDFSTRYGKGQGENCSISFVNHHANCVIHKVTLVGRVDGRLYISITSVMDEQSKHQFLNTLHQRKLPTNDPGLLHNWRGLSLTYISTDFQRTTCEVFGKIMAFISQLEPSFDVVRTYITQVVNQYANTPEAWTDRQMKSGLLDGPIGLIDGAYNFGTDSFKFFRRASLAAAPLHVNPPAITLLIRNHKLTGMEAILLTEQEKRNLSSPKIYEFITNNTLTVPAAKFLTEEQRVRLENGEDLQRVLGRGGPANAGPG